VKRSYADALTLDVKASDNIETVKAKIQGKTGITVDKLRLFFAGQQLKAEGTLLGYSTLADYGIKAMNTIEMMEDREKVKGGMPGVKKSNIKLKPKVAKVKTVLTTTAVQVPVIEQATAVAVQFAAVTTAAADEVVADMTTESLLACKAFMNEDRTHIEKKLEKICEYTTQWQKLEAGRLLIAESRHACHTSSRSPLRTNSTPLVISLCALTRLWRQSLTLPRRVMPRRVMPACRVELLCQSVNFDPSSYELMIMRS